MGNRLLLDISPTGVQHYASVLSKIVEENDLAPFDRTAVAALVEHGARIASRRGKPPSCWAAPR